jgi:hypothetical protein
MENSFNRIIKRLMDNWETPGNELVNSKLLQKDWLKDNNFPYAELYKTVDINHLTPEDISKDCVLKPSDGAATIGVLLLQPRNGKWFELKSGRLIDFKTIQGIIKNVKREKPFYSDTWIIEERLVTNNQAPYEYKCFAFNLPNEIIIEVIAVNLRQNGHTTARWYDINWRPIEVGRSWGHTDVNIQPPNDKDGVIKLTKDVSQKLPYPFVRVDIFETSRGLVVGEINAWDGIPTFNNYWDKRLADLYNKAKEYYDNNSSTRK